MKEDTRSGSGYLPRSFPSQGGRRRRRNRRDYERVKFVPSLLFSTVLVFYEGVKLGRRLGDEKRGEFDETSPGGMLWPGPAKIDGTERILRIIP